MTCLNICLSFMVIYFLFVIMKIVSVHVNHGRLKHFRGHVLILKMKNVISHSKYNDYQRNKMLTHLKN